MARPLIGMISRMVDQKGLDLIAAIARRAARGWTRASSCSARAKRATRTCGERWPPAHPDRVGAHIGFDEATGASDRGGRRHLPDAVAVRALRPEPDVQPPLRHGAGRPGRRRPCRHRRRLCARASVARPAFVFREYTPEALLAALRRALELFRDRRRWRALQRAGHGRRIIPGTVRPGSTSKYMNGLWPGRGGRVCHMGSGEETMTENVQTFTDGNFESVGASTRRRRCWWISGRNGAAPASGWRPTVDALAAEYAGKVTIGKLNVDENPNTAFKFQIRGIPALLLFKGGQVVESVVGLAHKDDSRKSSTSISNGSVIEI